MKTRHSITLIGAAALFLACGNAAALAHAELRRAVPAVGAIVSTPPAEVLVNFSEPVEATFSSVVIRDAVGKRVDKADAHVDPKDRTTMHVSLQPLGQGTYIVVWRTLTTDTHRTEGAFTFRVGGSQ